MSLIIFFISVTFVLRQLECEDVYIKEYPTVIALRSGLREYFQFYNDERPHDSLDKCTPSEFYNGLRVAA